MFGREGSVSGLAQPTDSRVEVPLPGPLVAARFRARPNRFVVHAELADKTLAVAHLADPGRLRELLVPGRRIWLRRAPSPTRKTSWSAVLVETPDHEGLVSLDTTLPNRLVLEALRRRGLAELDGWRLDRPELSVEGSRFDFLLRKGRQRADANTPTRLLLEVKSVTLVEEGVGLFPDAVTARGTRHVRKLTRLQGQGDWETALLFVVQRQDATRLRAAKDIDPAFAEALAEARRAGVRVWGRRCKVSLRGVRLGPAIPMDQRG